MNIGKKLKSLRKGEKLTLRELSSKTGLSISFISDIENQRKNPSIDNLKLLADALNVPVANLLDDSNDLKAKKIQYKKYELLDEEFNLIFEKVEKLSKEDKQKVLKMLDIFTD